MAASRKRKHDKTVQSGTTTTSKKVKQIASGSDAATTIQVVTGDYERVLHGIIATLPPAAKQDVTWSETFLFTAHTASIRSLAISPVTENGKRFLATGSADERINVYAISNVPPAAGTLSRPTLNGTVIAENAGNRSLGSLNHHDRAITRLHFPTKAKLFSSAEDNTIAISRSRDWTMLSSIKAPIPKMQGRPSGDTAAPGEVPSGINDFAIHPSQKLMLSVSRGERCMRLWNLMTSKKAGVLNFDRDLLSAAGETKFSSGEGRRVLWDVAGENYIVAFERGAILFGIDSIARAVIKSPTPTKLHQFRVFKPIGSAVDMLAASTEDGRILVFPLSAAEAEAEAGAKLPLLPCIAQIGGRSQDVISRIKDFELLQLDSGLVVVSASSDGTIRLWDIQPAELTAVEGSTSPGQIGRLLGLHKMESRVTCLGAFVMDSKSAIAGVEHADLDFASFSDSS